MDIRISELSSADADGACYQADSNGQYQQAASTVTTVSDEQSLLSDKPILKHKTMEESLSSSFLLKHKEMEDLSRNVGQSSKRSKSIKFGKLITREYGRTVGDNPSCSSGPPISCSWEYTNERECLVDEYESKRGPRRSEPEMIIPRSVRHYMLKEEWQVSRTEITESVREMMRVKYQRRSTINNLKVTRFEEIMENVMGVIKRAIGCKKPVDTQVEILEQQAEEAQRVVREQRMLRVASLARHSQSAKAG